MLDEQKRKQYLEFNRKRKRYEKISVWAVLILYALIVSIGLVALLFWGPKFIQDLLNKTAIIWPILFIVLGILLAVKFIGIGARFDKTDLEYCNELKELGLSAEELWQLSKEYDLRQMYNIALEVRLKELSKDRVPEWFMRDCYKVRLPELKDFK